MAEARRQLLTLGALLIVIVAGLLLVPFIGWYLVVPVILMLFGLWLLALGLMRSGDPQKYERNVFSTLSLGLLLIAVGGGLSMIVLGSNWVYSLALILLLLAALAIAEALRRK